MATLEIDYATPYETGPKQLHDIGQRAETPNGDIYRYAKMGATVGVANKLYQGSIAVANWNTQAHTVSIAIGDTEISFTSGGGSIAAGEAEGGTIIVELGTDLGHIYRVKSNPPTAANQTDYVLGDRDAPANERTWEVLGDQAMQNVWLLIAEDIIVAEIFQCPSDKDFQARDASARFGWTDPRQYSYGMQWPYAENADGNRNPARLGSPGPALMADWNPGGPLGESRPPSNHATLGTNFVLANGAVKYDSRMVSTIGRGGDDIYANDAGEAGGMPQVAKDTSITLSGR